MAISLEKTPAMLFSRSLVHLKYIQHIQDDMAKVDEIKQGSVKIAFLNQTYVLHLIASWEVFIEDLIGYGVRKLEARDGSNHLSKVAAAHIENRVKQFHSPNTANIDALFCETLDIRKISDSWDCDGLSRDQATSTLSLLITARNEMAHTGSTSKSLSYVENFERMETLVTMAKAMEARLIKELKLS